MTRIVFMGTPDIACGILHQLIQDNYEIVGVVTQPDKKAGRKQELKESEVKQMLMVNLFLRIYWIFLNSVPLMFMHPYCRSCAEERPFTGLSFRGIKKLA